MDMDVVMDIDIVLDLVIDVGLDLVIDIGMSLDIDIGLGLGMCLDLVMDIYIYGLRNGNTHRRRFGHGSDLHLDLNIHMAYT